jgi:pyruvate/2-oxoglutarate dehydrogenase complex dihydrolipoamide acyltransferase (E2) component
MTTSTPVATEKAAELADKLGLKLEEIKGTGTDGRITIEDVRAAAPEASAVEAGEPMPDRAHKEGCPAIADRIEVYEQKRPAKVDAETGLFIEPARMIKVAHCIECGETITID